MRMAEELGALADQSFNSKRCDYETKEAEDYINTKPVSIPKGAIMSKFICNCA